MMRKNVNKSYCWILAALSILSTSVSAVPLFVTTLLDDGSPGSLRETIAAASSGDEILFSVSGTIVLSAMAGTIIVDKSLVINGQDKITVDGADAIAVGFHVTNSGTADASNSVIKNIALQNFNGDNGGAKAGIALESYGILIDGGAQDCYVTNVSVTNVRAGVGQLAAGIAAREDVQEISNTAITNVSTADNASGDTGRAIGIFVDGGAVTGDFYQNAILTVYSGVASGSSGDVQGAALETVEGSCFANTVQNLATGQSDFLSRGATGLWVGAIQGDCYDNTIADLSSGFAEVTSGFVRGIQVDGSIGLPGKSIGGNCFNNAVLRLSVGDSNGSSGDAHGFLVANAIEGDCYSNRVELLTGGIAVQASGEIEGMLVNKRIGGICFNNTIQFLTSGNATAVDGSAGRVRGITTDEMRGVLAQNTIQFLKVGTANMSAELGVLGVFVREFFDGDCVTNVIADLDAGQAPASFAGGLWFAASNEVLPANSLVECNTIARVAGGSVTNAFGLRIDKGHNFVIRNNAIAFVTNAAGPAHGIVLGSDEAFTSSFVFCNVVTNVSSEVNSGFGITVIGDTSLGNDLLHNSIFNNSVAAIGIVPIVDAKIVLQSIRCFDGCRFVIEGFLVPLVTSAVAEEFLVQFFVSGSHDPCETELFIGERIIPTGSFKISLTTAVPITFGKFITATATALPFGSVENNNTTEVSNALATCASVSTFCQCPDTPPVVCIECVS